jgi:ATP-dependent Zn protease
LGPENYSRGQKRKARNTTPDATENVSVHPAPRNLVQPQLAEGGPPHHNSVRQPSVDLPNRVEDRNRSAQLTEGNNSDTRPVNPDGRLCGFWFFFFYQLYICYFVSSIFFFFFYFIQLLPQCYCSIFQFVDFFLILFKPNFFSVF